MSLASILDSTIALWSMAFLITFWVFGIAPSRRIFLQVIIAWTSLTFQLIYHLLVVEAENFKDFWLNTSLREKFIVSHTLAYFMNAVDIFNILAVFSIDLDQSFHKLSLQFNNLASIETVGYRHSTTDTNRLMLMGINFGLDILENTFLKVWILRQHSQVLGLFYFNHLNKGLTNLPVLPGNDPVCIQGSYSTSLFLKQLVHLSDSVDWVSLLPNKL